MGIEEVQGELQAVKTGANEFATSVEAMADEEPYATLPSRAQRVAELATEMADLIDGILADAADYNFRSNDLRRDARERLGGIAARALAGSNDAAAPHIIGAIKSLDTGEFDLREYSNGTFSFLTGADARAIGQRALTIAGRLTSDRKDITNVTRTSVGRVVTMVDSFGRKL